MKVFVSYTSRDPAVTKTKLEQVEKKITPYAKVFIDLLHNKRGKQRRVNRELRRCDVVLQLVSPRYKSEWVQKELITARKNGKTIIKVRMDELIGMDDEQLYLLLSDVEKKGWSVWTILFLSLLVCVGVSILGIWLSYLFVGGQDLKGFEGGLLTARGVFGDSWGGVNAIISAFAFAGVIVTLFLQNRDLNLQRKEMARQCEEFEKENETLKYQRFENTFFNMLSQFQEVVNNLSVTARVKGENVDFVGREVFQTLFEKATIYVPNPQKNGEWVGNRGMIGVLKNHGLDGYMHSEEPTQFDHYFRLLYRILKFVRTSPLITRFEDEYEYTSILRATLSRYELVWLYYNGLTYGQNKLKPLIERYAMLKNLRIDLLVDGINREEYAESAYRKTSP